MALLHRHARARRVATWMTPSPYRWWVLAAVVAVNLVVTGVAWNHVAVVAADLVRDLGGSFADDWGQLWAAISLGVVITSIPAGALGDRLGPRWALGLGLALVGALLLARAQASSFTGMYLALLGFGAGLALVLANFPKAVGVWFPPAELGLANGVAQAGVGAGVGLTFLVTPTLVDVLDDWRGLTSLLGYACLALAALWVASVRDPRAGAAPAGLVSGLLRVLRVRDARRIALCYGLYVAGYLGAIGYLPTFVGDRGLDARMISAGPWSFIAGSLVLPLLSDRIGLRRVVYLPGMLAGSLALVAVAYAGSGSALLLAIVALGFGTGVVGLLFVVPAELEGVGPELAGSAVGVATTAGFLGGWAAPVVGIPLVETSPALALGFFAACIGASGVAVLTVRETGPATARGSS